MAKASMHTCVLVLALLMGSVLGAPDSEILPLGGNASGAEVLLQTSSSQSCTPPAGNCFHTRACCGTYYPVTCYAKSGSVAVCRKTGTCVSGINPSDPPGWQQPWSCEVLSAGEPSGPAHTPTPAPLPSPEPAPAPTPPSTAAPTPALRGHIMTLYHQTSKEIGELILKSSFKSGSSGWCGGGIYFAKTPEATFTKAIGANSHQGFIIEARVDLGRMKQLTRTCDGSMTGAKLQSEGYDSLTFNPGDGDEFVIYSADRVLSTRHYSK